MSLVTSLFFAIDLPPENKEKLAEFLHVFHQKTRPEILKLVEPKFLHITLQFLGNIDQPDISLLLQNVQQSVSKHRLAGPICFSQLKLFPNPQQAKVIVFDVQATMRLSKLAKRIYQGVCAAGYAVKPRIFRPHLTIGKIIDISKLDLSLLSLTSPQELWVKEICLFESKFQEHETTYTIIKKIALEN